MSDEQIMETPTYKKLLERLGPKVTRLKLCLFAETVSKHFNIPLPRDVKKHKIDLFNWFEVNYDIIFPAIDNQMIVVSIPTNDGAENIYM